VEGMRQRGQELEILIKKIKDALENLG
jgi:hypothetical protein